MNNWYAIIGASASGKTTLVKAFEDRGYNVVHESARAYIDQEIANGKSLAQIRADEKKFQDKVLELKIEIEKKLPKDQLTFLDRGMPDSAAYYRLYEYPPNPVMDEAIKNCSYKKIFLLDQLPYVIDNVRTETKEQQDLLHKYLEEEYRKCGFEIVNVPAISVPARMHFILKNL